MTGSGTEEARRAALHETLSEARNLGFLGPGDVDRHIRHALAFARVVERAGASECGDDWIGRPASAPARHLPAPAAADGPEADWRIADLGSGGGLPGLVVACSWACCHFVLVEAARRRAEFLLRAIDRLDLSARVSIVQERAELVGRDAGHRGRYDVVMARSFGAPSVTAECAAPLLKTGGLLVVSEPPADGDRLERWPAEGLALLGMGDPLPCSDEYRFEVVRQLRPCPPTYPRRTGVPSKRPLF